MGPSISRPASAFLLPFSQQFPPKGLSFAPHMPLFVPPLFHSSFRMNQPKFDALKMILCEKPVKFHPAFAIFQSKC
jgi:hypothetical protein